MLVPVTESFGVVLGSTFMLETDSLGVTIEFEGVVAAVTLASCAVYCSNKSLACTSSGFNIGFSVVLTAGSKIVGASMV